MNIVITIITKFSDPLNITYKENYDNLYCIYRHYIIVIYIYILILENVK